MNVFDLHAAVLADYRDRCPFVLQADDRMATLVVSPMNALVNSQLQWRKGVGVKGQSRMALT